MYVLYVIVTVMRSNVVTLLRITVTITYKTYILTDFLVIFFFGASSL